MFPVFQDVEAERIHFQVHAHASTTATKQQLSKKLGRIPSSPPSISTNFYKNTS